MGDWIAFWDSDHSIYVNARHRDAHYRTIADDLARYVPCPAATVLDYGCGDALHADRVAAAAGRLILVDAAAKVRAALAERFRANHKIAVKSPAQLADLPDRSIDMVAMNSVAQYLSAAELSAILALFRRLLRPDGLLLIGDVVPPTTSALTDVAALIAFASAHGFLLAAILGLVRTALSDYRRLRSTLGLSRYSAAAMTDKLIAAGYAATRAPANIGYNGSRMTFLARPA